MQEFVDFTLLSAYIVGILLGIFGCSNAVRSENIAGIILRLIQCRGKIHSDEQQHKREKYAHGSGVRFALAEH